MLKLREADFYYGAVLSTLLNNHATPTLINSNMNRQFYHVTTRDSHYVAFLKYRKSDRSVKKVHNYRWDFNLKNDLILLQSFIRSGERVVMFLVCGNESLKDSDLVIIDTSNVKRIIDSKKATITVGREIFQRAYIYKIYMPDGVKDIVIKGNNIRDFV